MKFSKEHIIASLITFGFNTYVIGFGPMVDKLFLFTTIAFNILFVIEIIKYRHTATKNELVSFFLLLIPLLWFALQLIVLQDAAIFVRGIIWSMLVLLAFYMAKHIRIESIVRVNLYFFLGNAFLAIIWLAFGSLSSIADELYGSRFILSIYNISQKIEFSTNGVLRLAGFTWHPNTLAILGVLGSFGLIRDDYQKKSGFWQKLKLSAVIIVILLLTQSRGALLCFLATVAFLIIINPKLSFQKKLMTSLLILLCVIPLYCVSMIFRSDTDITSGRAELFQYSLDIMSKNIINQFFGVGFGNASKVLADNYETNGLNTHNAFLGALLENGILGFAVITLIMFCVTFYIIYINRERLKSFEVKLAIGILLSLWVYSLVEFMLLQNTYIQLVYFYLVFKLFNFNTEKIEVKDGMQ